MFWMMLENKNMSERMIETILLDVGVHRFGHFFEFLPVAF